MHTHTHVYTHACMHTHLEIVISDIKCHVIRVGSTEELPTQ